MPQFLISFLHWSQISFPGAFFWGLQTVSNRWGPDLENWSSTKAIRSATHVVLPLVHCLGERALFSSSFVATFWQFFPSNAPVMLYNIDGSSFLKVINEQNTLCIPKYRGQNLACWCLHLLLLWTALTCCYPISWLSIWLRGEVMDPRFIHCHIFKQKLLFVSLKQLQTNALNRWHVVFDQQWANVASTFNTPFSLTNLPAKWWIYCLLISSTPLLSHATSIYDQPKRVCGDFRRFLGQQLNLGDLSSQHHLCLYNHVKSQHITT